MGGIGSGRYEYAETPTVGQCYQLSADEFTEVIDGPDGGRLTLSWSDSIRMAVFIESDTEGPAGGLRFVYTSDPDGEAIKHDYSVSLTYTEPNFGGQRPWFLCPDCSDRAGKLYLPPTGRRFACRSCHELGYASSRKSGQPVMRAIQRYRNAFEKADAEGRRPHPNNPPYVPEKPTNMHRETFERLQAEVRQKDDEFHEAMRKREREILRNLKAD